MTKKMWTPTSEELDDLFERVLTPLAGPNWDSDLTSNEVIPQLTMVLAILIGGSAPSLADLEEAINTACANIRAIAQTAYSDPDSPFWGEKLVVS